MTSVRRVARWSGGVAGAAVLAAAGVATGTATLFVAAAIPLAYVAYGGLATVPPVEVAATREVEPSTVPPGRPVAVTLTVTNEGERVMPDLRVVDRVPEGLRVLDGTPRAAGTLRPGESLSVTYRVLAKRGTFAFDPPRVRGRNLPASAAATVDVRPAGDDRLHCRLDADAPPLADRATGYAGQLPTDRPGDGIEFHSTREYAPGDPTGRIDWRHYAKRGALATVNFREHLTADVLLVVDDRPPNRAVAGPGHPGGTELCAYAATRALAELLRAGHEVGVALLGTPADDGAGTDGDARADRWLPPGSGREHRARAEAVIRRAVDAGDGAERGVRRADAAAGGLREPARRVAERAAPGTQVLLFSPLLDDAPLEALDVWRAFGLPRGVIAPAVLADTTVGGQLAGARRHARLGRCLAGGARAVDWRRGTPLALALEYALAAEGGRSWS